MPAITSVSAGATQLAPVYLQTARAWAKGPTGQLLLRVLLDTGSQRSFIRRDVSRALACHIKGAEQLSLFTFGRTRPTGTIQWNLVSVTLKRQHDDQVVRIDALEVPVISVVTSPPIDDEVLRALEFHGRAAADFHLSDAFLDDQERALIGSALIGLIEAP